MLVLYLSVVVIVMAPPAVFWVNSDRAMVWFSSDTSSLETPRQVVGWLTPQSVVEPRTRTQHIGAYPIEKEEGLAVDDNADDDDDDDDEDDEVPDGELEDGQEPPPEDDLDEDDDDSDGGVAADWEPPPEDLTVVGLAGVSAVSSPPADGSLANVHQAAVVAGLRPGGSSSIGGPDYLGGFSEPFNDKAYFAKLEAREAERSRLGEAALANQGSGVTADNEVDANNEVDDDDEDHETSWMGPSPKSMPVRPAVPPGALPPRPSTIPPTPKSMLVRPAMTPGALPPRPSTIPPTPKSMLVRPAVTPGELLPPGPPRRVPQPPRHAPPRVMYGPRPPNHPPPNYPPSMVVDRSRSRNRGSPVPWRRPLRTPPKTAPSKSPPADRRHPQL